MDLLRSNEYRRELPENFKRFIRGTAPGWEAPQKGPSEDFDSFNDLLRFGAVMGKHDPFDRKYKTVEELDADHPNVRALANQMVKARLGMYSSDEDWAKDKDYGWILDIKDNPAPESRLFQPRQASDGSYWGEDTEEAEMLKQTNPQMYQALYDKFVNDITGWAKNSRNYALRSGTREEAGESPWYRTTDELSDAITSDEGIGREYDYALQRVLQDEFLKTMQEDMASKNPTYLNALKRHLMSDWDYSKGNPTFEDLRQKQAEARRSWLDREEFERPSALKTAPVNLVAPAFAKTHFDPELNYKTSKLEAGARLGSDLAVDALPLLYGPKVVGAGARALGTRVPYGLVPTAEKIGAVLGGGLSGLADYGVGRLQNTVLDATTGTGSDNSPINAYDATAAMLLGGTLGRPVFKSKGLPYGQRIRQVIDRKDPKTVTTGDIRDVKRVMKERATGKKTGVDNVSDWGTKQKYRGLAYEQYKKDYPDEMALRYPAPKADKQKYEEYFAHPMFAGWTDEQKDALWAVRNNKDFKQFFGSEPDIITPAEYAKDRRKYRGEVAAQGDVPQKNTGIHKLYENVKFGTGGVDDDGERWFREALPDQEKARKKSATDYHRRKEHKIPDFTTLYNLKREQNANYARPWQRLGARLTENVIPFGQVMGVEPMKYEDKKE